MNADALTRLTAPFALTDVDFKPQVLTKDRTKGMAATYVDARAVAARLDDVFGFGWSAAYRVVSDTEKLFVVECTLTAQVDGHTVSRADVGESSNGEREASRHKAAYSDALKRAAVQFGVGRYLYDLPKLWAEYDDSKKRWTDAGLHKLERDYQNAIAGLWPTPAMPEAAPAAVPAPTAPAPIAPSKTEALMGDKARRELFQALGQCGMKYLTENQKKKARGFVWFLNYGTVDGYPDSIKALTAREADTALHQLREDGAGAVAAFEDFLNGLRSAAA